MKLWLHIYSSLLALLLWSHSHAQDPASWQLTDEDGLPAMTVYSIIQDKLDYIWMGTSNGICRYDGTEILTYPGIGLNDNEILKVQDDAQGRIWFRNLSGQMGVIYPGEMFISEDNIAIERIQDFKIVGPEVYCVQQSTKIPSNLSLVRFEIDSNGELRNPHFFSEQFKNMTIMLTTDGSLLVAGSFHVNESFEFFKMRADRKSFIKSDFNRVESFKFANSTSDITLFFSENARSVSILENDLSSKEILRLSDDNGFNAACVYNERFFLLTQQGVIFGLSASQLTKEALVLKGLNCNTMLIDKENNHWIGTTGSGVIIIPGNAPSIYTASNSNLPNNEIYELFDDSNQLLIGHSAAHLSIISGSKNIVPKKFNSSGRITNISKDSDGDYWMVSDDNLLIADSHFEPIIKFASNYKSTLQDSRGDIWLTQSTGVLRIAENLIPLTKKTGMPIQKQRIHTERFHTVSEDFEGNIWMGSAHGLFYYNDKLNAFPESGLVENVNISDIWIDQDSVIWIATFGDGVIKVKNLRVLEKINRDSGLSSNTCKKIFIDQAYVWIATDNGLNILNKATNEIQIVNKSDGLPTNDINDVLMWDGKVWVGTSYGLVSLNNPVMSQNHCPPSIHVTSLKIWDRDTTFDQNLALHYDQNNLHIEYAGLAYRARGDVSYRYRLNGVDKDWVHTDSRFVRYPKLNAGNYLFEVYAINEDGTTSLAPASIDMVIEIAWWKSWWFRLLSIIIIMGVIGGILYWRWRLLQDRLIRENELQKKVSDLKQEALQTQMNPHFIFNSLNAIQQFITTNNSEQAMMYLAHFAGLVRMIFEHSKRKTISFDEEIEFIKLYLKLEALRFKGKIATSIHVDEAVRQESYQIELPPLLIQPLIENAFKHGLFHKPGKGNLTIKYSKEDHFLVCTITDDGVGRAAADKLNQWRTKSHKSSGISMARERLAIINKMKIADHIQNNLEIIDLYDSNDRAFGTQVVVRIDCKLM